MKLNERHKRNQCPCCGTVEILTLGLDQMCLKCDWDNSRLLVSLGQMDHLVAAAFEQFPKQERASAPKNKSLIQIELDQITDDFGHRVRIA